MNCNISVIIPLYNKENEIGRAIASVLSQTVTPLEIIVVDDGSTDRSAEIAENSGSPLIRLIRQENCGVSVARNRAINEAKGEYVALLDGDDAWREGYLKEICRMIEKHPDCAAYATAFDVESGGRLSPADTPQKEGIVDFFAEAIRRYVLIPSTVTLRRDLTISLGGFPEGMKLGEDQYLWTKIARARGGVCFSPKRLAIYSKSSQNRSAAIYTPERTIHSLEELYDETASKISNEYVARAALGKALTISAKGGTDEARRTAQFFAWTQLNRRTLRKLRLLNSLPAGWRAPLLKAYNGLAWLMMKKGL